MSKFKKALPYLFISMSAIYFLSVFCAMRFGFFLYLTPFVILGIAAVYSFRYGCKIFYFPIILAISLPLFFVFEPLYAVKYIIALTAMAFAGSWLGGYIHSKEYWS